MRIELSIPPVPSDFREHLEEAFGSQYSPLMLKELIETAWEDNQLDEVWLHSRHTGEAIVRYCVNKQHCGKLRFKKWHLGSVVATNAYGTHYVIIGSWSQYRRCDYSLRGIIRRKHENQPFSWTSEGSPDENAVMVRSLEDWVLFPQFEEIRERLNNIITRDT